MSKSLRPIPALTAIKLDTRLLRNTTPTGLNRLPRKFRDIPIKLRDPKGRRGLR